MLEKPGLGNPLMGPGLWAADCIAVIPALASWTAFLGSGVCGPSVGGGEITGGVTGLTAAPPRRAGR